MSAATTQTLEPPCGTPEMLVTALVRGCGPDVERRSMQIELKRAYDPPAPGDGRRVLVDRIWPRGVARDELRLDAWLKELAPSPGLRKWFGHDPGKWQEFKERYARELDGRPEALASLLEMAKTGRLTLVFGAKDTEHNNAVALKEYLARRESR